MYRCAGLQPVVFAARRNEPCLAGKVGFEPTVSFRSPVNSRVGLPIPLHANGNLPRMFWLAVERGADTFIPLRSQSGTTWGARYSL